MSELREVFEMVTKQTEPDVDAWNEQERRQRRASRNRKFGALAIAAAIGIVAVVVVIRAADEGTGTQPGGQPTPTAAQPIPSLPGGALEPGRYVFTSYDPGLDASYRISIDVADGYEGIGGWAARRIGTTQTGVNTLAIGDVYADPCQWEGSLLDRSAISTTDEVVVALASQEGLRVSTPTDVTVDGFAGTYLERRVPARTNLSDCDGGQFRVYLTPKGGGERYLVSGLLQQLWILDVDGVPLVVEAGFDPGTSAQIRAELLQMMESIRIDPV
jgi:hypothetical protein